jgi:quercetin dioxygenase-like cupin family protein
MNAATFRDQLAADGFTEVLERDAAPNSALELHEHPFDARLFILSGALRLRQGGVERVLRAGESCELARGEPHAEAYDGEGARLLIGRRYPAAG